MNWMLIIEIAIGVFFGSLLFVIWEGLLGALWKATIS